jgi:molybdenum cofactor cytidylyltransferase
MSVAGVVLAAGGSSRLGNPKQLLLIDGQSLLRRSVRAVLDSRCARVAVVTGAFAEVCTAEISDLPVEIIHNSLWADGMASSIRAAIHGLLERGQPLTALVLTVCDQPFLSPSIINQLLDRQEVSSRGIVASAYQGTFGSPALFQSQYFPALLNLSADAGARALFREFSTDFDSVDFPKGIIDIDTPTEYASFLKNA